MHQTMFPLLILDVLENHASRECPLTNTQITNFVNKEFAAFAFEKEQLINRSTVMRILDAMEFWTEGNLLENPENEWPCGLEMQHAPALRATLPSSRSLGKSSACLTSSCCYNPGGSLGPTRVVKGKEGPRAASFSAGKPLSSFTPTLQAPARK